MHVEIVQLFSNLIANAIDACRKGATIRVKIRSVDAVSKGGGRQVRITVADDGVGIAELAVARIYEPFYTIERDIATGLGLWVTRNIVDNHGGTICMRSRCGLRAPAHYSGLFSATLPSPSALLVASALALTCG
jgi:signal transduction histidine kinase